MSIAPNSEKANLWRIVASFGWCFVYSVWLDFTILIKDENIKWMNDFRRLLIYLPSFFFFYVNTRFSPQDSVEKFQLFWRDKYPSHLFEYIFTFYYVSYILAGIYIIYQWGRNSILNQEKKQARIIIMTGTTTLCLGIIIEKVLPLFVTNVFPLDIIIFTIPILGLFHAITTYQMMSLTTQVAGDYVLDTISDPVILIDRNMLIMEINNATLDLTGYTKNELLGRPLYMLISNRESYKDMLNDMIQSGPVSNIEIDLLSKKNHVIPCLFSESSIENQYRDELGKVCIFHDVTDQKKAEHILLNRQNELESIVYERTRELKEINRQMEEKIAEQINMEEILRANEEKFRALIMQSSDGIIVVDHVTMECLECNNIAKKLLGLPVNQIPNIFQEQKNIMNFDDIEEAITKLLHGDAESIKVTITYSKEDDDYRYLELSSTIVGYSNKQFLMITIRDISEEIIMEERKQQIAKMESLATLSGGIAHDFNNILAGIMGYTQLSLENLDKDSILYDNFTEIMKLGDRGKKLVSQILTFSKNTIVNLDNVDLNLIIEDVLKLIKSTFPANISIEYHRDNDPCFVYADSTQIHQMAMNLCVNAGMAMNTTGGILSVELTNIRIDKDLEVNYQILKKGKYIKLEVIDNGCGMDEMVRKRIFEPFYTTRGNQGGTGLGLSVVHGIISGMKGVIKVNSTPGNGSTFTIYLPASYINDTDKPASKNLVEQNNARILLVDDEEAIVTSSGKMLQGKGFTVTTAMDAREAYRLYISNKDDIDVVITDQSMPDMTGDELVIKLRLIKPELPIIICSGYSRGTYFEEDNKTIYLMKPVTLNEYINAIDKLLYFQNSKLENVETI